MIRFAKLYETESTQVLFYLDYDPDDDSTVLRHIFAQPDGTVTEVRLGWDGLDQEEKGRAALDRIDQAQAEELVRKFTLSG